MGREPPAGGPAADPAPPCPQWPRGSRGWWGSGPYWPPSSSSSSSSWSTPSGTASPVTGRPPSCVSPSPAELGAQSPFPPLSSLSLGGGRARGKFFDSELMGPHTTSLTSLRTPYLKNEVASLRPHRSYVFQMGSLKSLSPPLKPHAFIPPSVRPSIPLCVHPTVCASVHLPPDPVCMSICSSVHPSTHSPSHPSLDPSPLLSACSLTHSSETRKPGRPDVKSRVRAPGAHA